MSFPNPSWMSPNDPNYWHPVKGKPDVYRHKSDACQFEITAWDCPNCGSAHTVYHRVSVCKDHPEAEVATKEHRKQHSTCHGCSGKLKLRAKR